MSKARKEAYSAQVEYDTATNELLHVQQHLKQCEAELISLQGCEENYASVLQEKIEALKAAGGITAEQILQLEHKQKDLLLQKQKLQETLDIGSAVISCADTILLQLDDAEGLGHFDLFGGGLITGVLKHHSLNKAQTLVEDLQTQLLRFKTELTDITIDADIQIKIHGPLQVADYFFDGIIADWTVLDQIHDAQEKVQQLRNQICGTLDHLRALAEQIDAEYSRISSDIEQLVGSASI